MTAARDHLRTSAKVHRPTPATRRATSSGLRRFGCPTTLPLRWMPDRVRADLFALRDMLHRSPVTGACYAAAITAALFVTFNVMLSRATPDLTGRTTAQVVTQDHAQDTMP